MKRAPFVMMALAIAGCAHHQANQYAYAPPLAPPVYPQPQTAAQPVAYAAPTGAVPVVPAGTLPAGAPVAAAPVVAGGDPCCPPLEGGAMPVVYESGQTPPCPPGP
jgi:hypothetical protein